MRWKYFSLIILAVSFISNIAFADSTYTIKGRVLAEENNEILPSVPVYLKGTKFGIMTDSLGYFELTDIPNGKYTLSANCIGYLHFYENIDTDSLKSFHNIFLINQTCCGEFAEIIFPSNFFVKDSIINIEGRVIDAKTKDPIQYAEVSLGNSQYCTSTNAEGFYIIQNIPITKFKLTVSRFSYETQVKILDINRKIHPLKYYIELYKNLDFELVKKEE